MPEDPAEFYTKFAEEQDKQYADKDLAESFIALRERFCDLVPGNRVLDVGCGPGRDTAFFAEQEFDAVGIDIAPGMIQYARQHRKGTFHEMDVRELSFDADRFGGVWCSASLFFMPPSDMKRALEELNRVLRAGGVLYAGFKIGDGRHVKEKWESEVVEYHLQPETARQLLAEAGFDFIEQQMNTSSTGNDFIDFFCRKR